jgi:5'-3' exonuclease
MTLLLVDGHYFAYRSFFAIRGLSNSRGEPTNAVFGFVKALRRMLGDVRPDAAAVVWDAGLPERRIELLPTYKQQRKETPDDLRRQFPMIEEAVRALGVRNVSLPGHEADDLIASYAVQALARDARVRVVIATNDKDIFALAGDRVQIYTTGKNETAGKEEGFALLGVAEVEAKWGVRPEMIPDVLALTGDTADNIPGVPGVGPKTAAKLVREGGRVRALLETPEKITNENLREKVRESAQRVLDNLELVRLDEDLALPAPWEELSLRPDPQAMVELARRCEFRSLLAEYERLARSSSGAISQGELF